MKKITALLIIALFSIGALAVAAKPRIGMARATQIALKRVHGTITGKELEKEGGKWIYTFDIRTGKGKITEVHVDAYSGKVIKIEHENAKVEAKESKDEKKEKH